MPGWSPSTTTAASTSPSAAMPQRREAAWPSAQSGQTTARAPWRSTADRTSAAAWPRTTTRGVSPATAARACSSTGRPASGASCLGPPAKRVLAPAASTSPPVLTRAPRRLASDAHLVDAPRAVREPAAVAPVAHGDDLGHDRERGLLRGEGAEVEADGRGDARELGLLHALLEQPLPARRLRPARAHGADVAGVGAQGEHERGVVEPRLVGEDGDRR